MTETRVLPVYEKIAASHPSLSRGRVWCRTCGREKAVNAAHSLRHGWPKCCGYTMTIDHPISGAISPPHRREAKRPPSPRRTAMTAETLPAKRDMDRALIAEIAMDIGKEAVSHLRVQYPAAYKALREAREALLVFAAFSDKAERFVEHKAKFGGTAIFPVKDFRLSHFRRAVEVVALIDTLWPGDAP